MSESAEVAKKILDVIPPAMHWVRGEMRTNLGEELSIPQFRIMASIHRGRNIASEIAKYQGISQPAMSKMIDTLVARNFVERVANLHDRRHFHLVLTSEGKSFFQKTRNTTQKKLEKNMSQLDDYEREKLLQGLEILEKVFLLSKGKN